MCFVYKFGEVHAFEIIPNTNWNQHGTWLKVRSTHLSTVIERKENSISTMNMLKLCPNHTKNNSIKLKNTYC